VAEVEGVFSTFTPAVREVLSEMGLTKPTPPQEEAIPLISAGRNTLIVSPTGSGKTEAALLPIFDRMVRDWGQPVRGILLLYVTPLRALNRDLLDRVTRMCKGLDIKLAVRHGDTDEGERRAQTLAPPQVLFTTPETLQVLLVARKFKEHLRTLRWVVVDEIHELATDKRGTQLAVSLERLGRITEGEFQRIGLSATVGEPEKIARFLVGNGRECSIVTTHVAKLFDFQVVFPEATRRDEEEAARIMAYPEVMARLRRMVELLDEGPLLIFTNTRTEAETLTNRLRQWKPRLPVAVHHGSLSKGSRSMAEEELKLGRLKGVVCTSSLELGIDVGLLNLVIQYNSPRQVVRLIQRAGRSGHTLDRTSRCVVICQDEDDALEAAVLARRAKAEMLEEPSIHLKCGDVLVQQLSGLLIEMRRCRVDEVLALLRRSYPYSQLSLAELNEALAYMSSQKPKLATVVGDEVVRPQGTKGLFRYYFETLSMIPEQKQYPVVTEDGDAIGLLDEEFVAEYGEIGKKFILRGSVWKIDQVFNSKVYVKKDEDPLGAVPSWAGEEIPVPTEVAMEVGEIRRSAAQAIKTKVSLSELCESLSCRYPMGREEFLRALSPVASQLERGYEVPTDLDITIEKWKDVITLVTHRGLRVNRTLGRVLAYGCSGIIGKPVRASQDAYRIYLESRWLTCEAVAEALKGLCEQDLEALIRSSCEDTGLFRRRFVHVARKMGVLSREAELTSSIVRQLMDAYRGTLPYAEAWRTFMQEDLDARGTSRLLSDVASGRVKVHSLGGLDEPSPLAMIGLEEMTRKGEVMDPGRMKRLLLESARSRVLNGRTTVVCTSCWDYLDQKYLVDLPERLVCPACGNQLVASTRREPSTLRALLRKLRAGQKVTGASARLKKELEASALLNMKYGARGTRAQVFAVPLGKLDSVLAEGTMGEDELLLFLLDEERKTHLRRFVRVRG